MNKTELIAQVAETTGLSKTEVKKVIDGTMKTIVDAVKSEEKVVLVGFGSFGVTVRAEHQGINPATKKVITIPEKKVVKFKAGADFAF